MEIEFKFQVPPERLRALEKKLATGESKRMRLQARYFDTADGVLAAHGLVLRLRREGPRWVQTAKATLAGDGPLRRLEHNAELDPCDEGASTVPDVRRHAGSPVGKLLRKALKHCKDPLVETFATDISRLTRLEQAGESTVELALDIGKVMAGHVKDHDTSYTLRESPVCELELELVKGKVSDLVTLAGHWSRRHSLWLSTLSKAERGRRLVADEPTAAVKAMPPVFGKVPGDARDDGVSVARVQRAVLSACLAQVLPNASEVAAGVEDPETVHQLRVGLRRLRTALHELDGLYEKNADAGLPVSADHSDFDSAWEPALTGVFRVLGVHRDGHLLHDDVQPRLRKAGAPRIDMPAGAAEDSRVGDAVRATGFQAALVALIGFTEADSDVRDPLEASKANDAKKPLRRRLTRLYRQILRDGNRFGLLVPEAQHRVRKRLKRLRYLSEFVGPLFGDKAAARFVDGLVPAQDALGALTDGAVAAGRYRQAAGQDPHAWFAVGWLSAGRAGQVEDCQRQLKKLDKVMPFWTTH